MAETTTPVSTALDAELQKRKSVEFAISRTDVAEHLEAVSADDADEIDTASIKTVPFRYLQHIALEQSERYVSALCAQHAGAGLSIYGMTSYLGTETLCPGERVVFVLWFEKQLNDTSVYVFRYEIKHAFEHVMYLRGTLHVRRTAG